MKFKDLIKTNQFWFTISFGFVVIFGLLYKFTEIKIFLVLSIMSFIYPVFMGIIGILFAWIINPIKWLIKKKKEK